mmetsp:Transcript_47814/g.95799  ORF Transcript_47814/g.95799 Transcript_47814/m.95799 type:complete len:517 (+) Transcript_47814:157-1707(+)
MAVKPASASGEVADSVTGTSIPTDLKTDKSNEETNFFKFLKKDFEDLSLGPIKKPKGQRLRVKPNQDGQPSSDYSESRDESDTGSAYEPSAHPPESSIVQTGKPAQKMDGKESQEDAAAAWRAQRAQKSCLHSGREGGEKGADVKEWSTFETTWRVSTLPFRLMRNSVLSSWKPKTRPSWSSELEQAVTSLRTYIQNTPLNISMVRMIMDRAIPASTVPDGVTRLVQDLGANLKVCWSFPGSLRHQAEAARFILYLHGPNSSPHSAAHRGLVARLALECHAAVVTVDYRRAPENSVSESLEDVLKAYKWLSTQPAVTPAQLLVMADGLGAALAMSTVAELRDAAEKGQEDILPAACALISPWVDLEAPSDESLQKSEGVDYVSRRLLSFLASSYAGLLPLSDPAVSPMHLSLARFPPTLISLGQCEALLQQGMDFGAKLREHGVRVEVDEAEDQVHSFQLLAACHPACAAGILRMATFARRMSPGHMQISTAEVDALISQAAAADVFKPPDEPAPT